MKISTQKHFGLKLISDNFFCLQPILFLCVSFNDVLLVLCLNNLFLCLNIYQHFLLYIHTDLVKKNRELQIRKQMRRYLTGWTLPLLALILIPSQIGITWAPLAIAGLDQGDGQQTRKATLKYLWAFNEALDGEMSELNSKEWERMKKTW